MTAADDPVCRSCGGTAPGCRLREFVGGRTCCEHCDHDPEVTMPDPNPPTATDRDSCRRCPASAEGCQARRAFARERCCASCSHTERTTP